MSPVKKAAHKRSGNPGKGFLQFGPKLKRRPQWELRLYIAGQTAAAVDAIANLRQLCEEHLAGEYGIEVIDLLQHPQLAAGDQIIAVPTLVRQLPTPVKRIIGDLSNRDRVLVGLDLKSVGGR